MTKLLDPPEMLALSRANGAASRIVRQWDDANRLTGISNAYSAIDYGYDDAGQAKWEGNNITGSGGRVQTSYCRVTYPNGSTTLTRNYTARGQLQRVGSRRALTR